MPATRSRTENWRRSLQTLSERNGALEVTLPRCVDQQPDDPPQVSRDLIWRVRILDIDDKHIYVEEPMVLGRIIDLTPGVELVGIIAIGQNRWMFRTVLREHVNHEINDDRRIRVMKLDMPTSVERCQRREFYRVSTVGLRLPGVEVYPLLDPSSAVVAETANRLEILRLQSGEVAGSVGKSLELPPDLALGPPFDAVLMNIGGGGVGLMVEPHHRAAYEAHRTFWLRVELPPMLTVPMCVSARHRHSHIDSSQRLYAGLSFDFGSSRDHEQFVVDQICRYVAEIQREQLARQADA